jgi:hypothetical protein
MLEEEHNQLRTIEFFFSSTFNCKIRVISGLISSASASEGVHPMILASSDFLDASNGARLYKSDLEDFWSLMYNTL